MVVDVVMRVRVCVVVMRVGMGMTVSMARIVRVIMRMRVCVVVYMPIVAMLVRMFKAAIFFFGMHLSVCCACVFKPEFGHGISHDSSQTA